QGQHPASEERQNGQRGFSDGRMIAGDSNVPEGRVEGSVSPGTLRTGLVAPPFYATTFRYVPSLQDFSAGRRDPHPSRAVQACGRILGAALIWRSAVLIPPPLVRAILMTSAIKLSL